MRTSAVLEKLLYGAVRLDERRLERALRGKTILITGASSGIGEQTARLLGRWPVRLILAARRGDKLASIKADIERGPARVTVLAADLRNDEQLTSLIETLQRQPDGLDIVVSNAGLSIRRPVLQSLDRFHDFTRTMAINYFAPVRLLLSAIPLLQRRQGHIINVSTINASIVPFPNWAAYQASKTAFDVWLRSAAPELNAAGIAVTNVYLPLVRTPMIEPTPAYRNAPAMSAEQAARLVARSIYARRPIVRPWWLVWGQLGSVLFRGVWERFMTRRLRRRKREE